ncbi:acetyl esterase/lipase [Mucilaginibacter frigoritolerans]|uniref:Acetyl esterase/lipase n=1 Tax=Mucilaginibacter frigoritolerans TaxID=652788 RepID=A0A562UDX7_9SPHI|nr:alpha/beta hydrolase [Mucilaginibacter frigoritolerans]TWJ03431.1 acetyl esterase/lipase [Mucilaginibacter frigoritolerans]
MKKAPYVLLATMLMSTAIFAQIKPIPLYPNGVPNSKATPASYVEKNDKEWVTGVSVPTITPYLPAHGYSSGTAVIIFPGGGYVGLSMDNEGASVAKELNKIGVAAFVVKYRLPTDDIMVDKTIGPLQDGQQAIIMVRSKAAGYGIKPDQIGIMGFSAGGHLASTLGTHFDKVLVSNPDNVSARPDFMLLLYPVITMGSRTHAGSRENLLGKTPPQSLVDEYSNEKQVDAHTPPTFLVQAADDTVVPIQNSLMFFNALLTFKVKAEMHIFQAGGHGFGLDNSTTKDKWMDWAKNWLEQNKFL